MGIFWKKRAKVDKPADDSKLLEAAEWLTRLEGPDVSHEQCGQWLSWIEGAPENRKAFDEIVGTSGRLMKFHEQLVVRRIPDDKDLLDDEYDPSIPVAAWLEQRSRTLLQRRRWPYAIAAVLAIASIGTAFVMWPELERDTWGTRTFAYETAASQHDQARLVDGSTIEIGADSALTVSFSREQRTVILEKGEAFFVVAKDLHRPFVVVAGSGTITAVGTEFNVRRDIERVVVTVAEGVVEVSQQIDAPSTNAPRGMLPPSSANAHATKLVIGEQVAYDSLGITHISQTDPEFATSWKEGRLQYLREPLRFVVTGVNRYSDMTIVIADSDIDELLFTGTVFDGQTSEWLESLGNVLPVQVEYVGNNMALLKKK
jgi:transmembrane sensor